MNLMNKYLEKLFDNLVDIVKVGYPGTTVSGYFFRVKLFEMV